MNRPNTPNFLQHRAPTSSSAVHSTPLNLERSLDIVGNDLFDNLSLCCLEAEVLPIVASSSFALPYLQSSIIVGRVHRSQLNLERLLYIVGNDLFDNLVVLPLSRIPPYRRSSSFGTIKLQPQHCLICNHQLLLVESILVGFCICSKADL